MTKYIRYTLAALCLAASVGCLALRCRSVSSVDEWVIWVPRLWQGSRIDGTSCLGCMAIAAQPLSNTDSKPPWRFESKPVTPDDIVVLRAEIATYGRFRMFDNEVIYFPLWYPALIFSLAGISTLRLGRRFTLRSAIIATTVVAGLLGMPVIL